TRERLLCDVVRHVPIARQTVKVPEKRRIESFVKALEIHGSPAGSSALHGNAQSATIMTDRTIDPGREWNGRSPRRGQRTAPRSRRAQAVRAGPNACSPKCESIQ